MRCRLSACVTAALLALSVVSASAQPPQGPPGGQRPPEPPKNLQVLPKDWTRDQVVAVMRRFTQSLGVNCMFCHVGDNPRALDYPADDKDEKRVARLMLKMVNTINTGTIAELGHESPSANVTCYTCHRGAKEPPRRLGDILAETAASSGADAAMAKYKALRDESLEAGLYDFRPPMIASAADQLRQQKKVDEALGLLRAGAALYPKSSEAAALLGVALAESGNAAGAEAELNRALTLDPNNRMARGALDRLKGTPPAPPQR